MAYRRPSGKSATWRITIATPDQVGGAWRRDRSPSSEEGTPKMSFRFKPQWQGERANAQEIGRSLRRLGIPSKDVSDAMPCLFRSSMTYKKHTQERSLSQIPVSFIFIVPYFWVFSPISKSDGSTLGELSDPNILNIAVVSLL